ncbi:hypothetical protein ACLOJK_008725 [Asimina triloba]
MAATWRVFEQRGLWFGVEQRRYVLGDGGGGEEGGEGRRGGKRTAETFGGAVSV